MERWSVGAWSVLLIGNRCEVFSILGAELQIYFVLLQP